MKLFRLFSATQTALKGQMSQMISVRGPALAVMLPLATVMSAVAIAVPVAAAAPSKKHAAKAPSLRLQNKQQAEQLHPLSERRFPSQPLVQGAGQATAIDAEGSD